MKEIDRCRICGSEHLLDVFDVGSQSITSRFPAFDEPDPPVMPMIVTQCQGDCGLVQMRHTVPPNDMYFQTYGYRSGLNTTMTAHLEGIHKEMVSKHKGLRDGSIVLDIGSNDGTLLSFYSEIFQRIGVDPTGMQFIQYYPQDVQLIADFFTRSTFENAVGKDRMAQCITTISMFYDLPDPLGFMQDVADILDPMTGIWIMEQSYLPTMLDRNSFDTICHEHLEYYALHQIQWMVERTGLRIFDVSTNDCNGGSFRISICHNNALYDTNSEDIDRMLQNEMHLEILTPRPFYAFKERCTHQKRRLQLLVQAAKRQDRTIYLYGASTKGNTLLQYYGLDGSMIDGAAERNPIKYGRRTPGTNIPIMCEDDVRAKNPHFMLVLPWHFREEFMCREEAYLEKGGRFVFPLPTISIVSKKPKVLVTGASGQIGEYLITQLVDKGYEIYATSTDTRQQKDARVFYFESPGHHDICGWKDIIELVQPEHFYHLAAYTSSVRSIESPVETIDVNGTLTCTILEALRQVQPHTRFVQTNSTELFKGCTTTNVLDESNIAFHPCTPYAIGKLASYWIVRYYREIHGMRCCSGILTNTESPLRSTEYVTQKVCTYLKEKTELGNTTRTLHLGNIDVYRDWVHAEDAAAALIAMMNQDKMKDCIIASGNSHTVREWIDTAVSLAGYKTMEEAGITANSDVYRIYEKTNDKCDVYNNSLLKSLGWKCTYSFTDIVQSMMQS